MKFTLPRQSAAACGPSADQQPRPDEAETGDRRGAHGYTHERPVQPTFAELGAQGARGTPLVSAVAHVAVMPDEPGAGRRRDERKVNGSVTPCRAQGPPPHRSGRGRRAGSMPRPPSPALSNAPPRRHNASARRRRNMGWLRGRDRARTHAREPRAPDATQPPRPRRPRAFPTTPPSSTATAPGPTPSTTPASAASPRPCAASASAPATWWRRCCPTSRPRSRRISASRRPARSSTPSTPGSTPTRSPTSSATAARRCCSSTRPSSRSPRRRSPSLDGPRLSVDRGRRPVLRRRRRPAATRNTRAPRRRRPRRALDPARGRVGEPRPQLHLRHHRPAQGRRLPPPRRLPDDAWAPSSPGGWCCTRAC